MRDLTYDEATELYRDRQCPFCRRTDFLGGPRGGASMNIECAACGAQFNALTPLELGARFLPSPVGQVLRDPTRTAPGAVLSMWTVYDHPADFPHHYIARRFEVVKGEVRPTDEIITRFTLVALQTWLEQRGLYRLARDDSDDERIVETWL